MKTENSLPKNTCWIWSSEAAQPDEYVEFLDFFSAPGAEAELYISADSNFEVFLNGECVDFGQYADFPKEKVYDRVDLTPYVKKKENVLAIRVWYYGIKDSFTYAYGKAGLFYHVFSDGMTVAQSSARTLCRLSPLYVQHQSRRITVQLGLGYAADLRVDENWILGDTKGFKPAVELYNYETKLRPRPCPKPKAQAFHEAAVCRSLSETDRIFDLGEEEVGLLRFEIESPAEQQLIVAFGEHLRDGKVRRIIGARDFSASFTLRKGKNVFLNGFRRLGCRYLEVISEVPLTVESIGLIPTQLELIERPRPQMNEVQRSIYERCIRTLRLCLHEHYEDCPWREQSLYAMDSRNQMLCGYEAFEGSVFQKASLDLMARDRREDKLLSICFPISQDFAIPSFSLHYVQACREYLEHTGDEAFIRSILPRLREILQAFLQRRTEGLIPPFPGPSCWNFYEWRHGLGGELAGEQHDQPDVVLNALTSFAVQNLTAIEKSLGEEPAFPNAAEELNKQIRASFYSEEKGLFMHHPDGSEASELGNALAILCGAASGVPAEQIAAKLAANAAAKEPEMIPTTLSMVGFKYDAMLKVDPAYGSAVLEMIERDYRLMLGPESSTVWEVAEGPDEWGGAGSMCHGWSAMPIVYYHRLLK